VAGCPPQSGSAVRRSAAKRSAAKQSGTAHDESPRIAALTPILWMTQPFPLVT
jgi:hypothetical protein